MITGDRVVWVGSELERPVGSSGKVGVLTRYRVEVNWGDGDTGLYKRDEVVSCKEAARRGIEPWSKALS